MPMFQADSGRSVALHPIEPAQEPLDVEASSMVADHLDTLLGEHLLPLRIRQGDADEPYLLAVDAAGQPVVVEVVALLDERSVMDALRHAGHAARMSTQDLARAYRGGADRFAAHLAAFRKTVPATSLLSTSVHDGSRLLLVCSEVDDGMGDVVEFLLQPGAQIEVLRVGVIEGADGARIVDVAPLVRTPHHRRAMEPTSLRLVRSGDVPLGPVQTSTAAGAGAPSLPLVGADDEQATRVMPVVSPPPFAVVRPPRGQGGLDQDPGLIAASPRPEPHPLLVAIAALCGDRIALIWTREQHGERRERHEALLHPDGFIELPDGSRHTDPDFAARGVSGVDHEVDGWAAWHVDSPDGPTLADLAWGEPPQYLR